MNWYIGQDIVSVKNHKQGLIKKGQVFVIKGLKNSWCKCNKVQIDVGVSDGSFGVNWCSTCRVNDTEKTYTNWLSENLFAPLDSIADITELTEILETTKPFEIKQ